MSKAVETEQWRAVETREILEKRTYKNGRVNYYVKGSGAWGQVEKYWVEKHWLAKKFFVKEEEYEAIKKEQNEDAMRRFWLNMAHRAGGVKAEWERK